MPNLITVRVLKHDGAESRRWHALFRREQGSLIVLDAEFDSDVSHELIGTISRGTRTVEYYWRDRWYNVFRFLAADGSTKLWYCNINTPPILKDNVLTYIDLDLDIVVRPDFSYQLLDLDEFASNAEAYGYSEEEKIRAHAATNDLISLIRNHEFPFLLEDSSGSSVVTSC